MIHWVLNELRAVLCSLFWSQLINFTDSIHLKFTFVRVLSWLFPAVQTKSLGQISFHDVIGA